MAGWSVGELARSVKANYKYVKTPFPTRKICIKDVKPSEKFMIIFITAVRLTFTSCFSRFSSFNVFQ